MYLYIDFSKLVYPSDDEQTQKDTREHFGLSETRAEDLVNTSRKCDSF